MKESGTQLQMSGKDVGSKFGKMDQGTMATGQMIWQMATED